MAATIIFDLGGVLVHLNWDKVCTPLTELSVQSYDEVLKEVQNGPIVQSSMVGQLSSQEFHQALCTKIQVEIKFDPFIDIWNSLLSEDQAMSSFVLELASSHRLILASNTDAIHIEYCRRRFNVLGRFNRLFLSNEMGLIKPDPAYFQHVLDELHTPPADCIFIDDRSENVLSARELGINSLVFESIDRLKSDLSKIT
jgi:putative hydrolase of the HAD superfamily